MSVKRRVEQLEAKTNPDFRVGVQHFLEGAETRLRYHDKDAVTEIRFDQDKPGVVRLEDEDFHAFQERAKQHAVQDLGYTLVVAEYVWGT